MSDNALMTSRRRVLTGMTTTLAALLAAPSCARKSASGAAIRMGCILDATGPLSLEGKPMIQTARLAVEELNAAGGLLGRQIKLITYDTQSTTQLYTQYAQRLALEDAVDVVVGGLTSASREAIRPIFGRATIPLFYPTLYEGGVCDRNVFCTGTTPTQTVSHLIDHALEHWGKSVYILAADYNFGQITAGWVRKFMQVSGGPVVQADFLPLEATNFSSTISRIQSAAPAFVFSVLVGGAQTGFYRQWNAAGMKSKIPIASNVFGLSDELSSMDAATTDGIVTCYGWYPNIDSAGSKAFVASMSRKFGPTLTGLSELDVATYDAIMLWAAGVRKAGSLERLEVFKALETGISYDGPAGRVVMDPATHHAVRTTHLARARNRAWEILQTFANQRPADTEGQCDLLQNPALNKQFSPAL